MSKEEIIKKILDVELMLDGLHDDLEQLNIGIQETQQTFDDMKKQLQHDYQISDRDIELIECQEDLKFLTRLYDNFDHLLDLDDFVNESEAYQNKKEELSNQISTLLSRIKELQNTN